MEFIYIATFFVAFISSILSGIAGGGGGFLMAPYWLIAGLTPSQGAATGAFMAVGMGGSASLALRRSGNLTVSRNQMAVFISIASLASIIGPATLQYIPVSSFKIALAVLTAVSIPFLFVKPKLHKSKNSHLKAYVLLVVTITASSFITSSAFSILITIILMQFFGMNSLQSIATRRLIGTVQSLIILIILVSLGSLVWQHAIAGFLGGILGSYIGTKIAIKRGETFAKYALAIGALIGATALFLV